jgi:hypothetical protein
VVGIPISATARRLTAYGDCSNISVISHQKFEELDAATIDIVIITSVIRHLPNVE